MVRRLLVATCLVVVLGALLSLPVSVRGGIDEFDLYYGYLSKIVVKLYEWDVSHWDWFADRNFCYGNDSWWAKKLLYTDGMDYHNVSLLKPNGKGYNVTNDCFYCPYIVAGLRDSKTYNVDVAPNSLVICVGANWVSKNASQKLFFIDSIYGFGAYRKDVYWNGQKIFSYPNGQYRKYPNGYEDTGVWIYGRSTYAQQLGWAFYDSFPNQTYISGSGSVVNNDTVSNPDRSMSGSDEIAKRLRVDFMSCNNTSHVFYPTFSRPRMNNATDWWVRKYGRWSYMSGDDNITTYMYGVIDILDNGTAFHNVQKEYGSSLMMYLTTIYWDNDPDDYVLKLDGVFEGGSAKNLFWERDHYGSKDWALVWNGSRGFNPSDNSGWSPWGYNITLENVRRYDFGVNQSANSKGWISPKTVIQNTTKSRYLFEDGGDSDGDWGYNGTVHLKAYRNGSYFWFWIGCAVGDDYDDERRCWRGNFTGEVGLDDYDVVAYFGATNYTTSHMTNSCTGAYDLDFDGTVGIDDLARISATMWKDKDDADWESSFAKMYDILVYKDGKIDTVHDEARVSAAFGTVYTLSPFLP